ncbi:hypothetical protein N7527_011713 [Penicillium freii]|nr:hypothetical protein N7527_011713 [Penicillium freii]
MELQFRRQSVMELQLLTYHQNTSTDCIPTDQQSDPVSSPDREVAVRSSEVEHTPHYDHRTRGEDPGFHLLTPSMSLHMSL